MDGNTFTGYPLKLAKRGLSLYTIYGKHASLTMYRLSHADDVEDSLPIYISRYDRPGGAERVIDSKDISFRQWDHGLIAFSQGECVGFIFRDGDDYVVSIGGEHYKYSPDMPWSDEPLRKDSDRIVSPLPGIIQKIFCRKGDMVSEGDLLLIINAMKMENEIRAPMDGTVRAVVVREGEQVQRGDAVVDMDPLSGR